MTFLCIALGKEVDQAIKEGNKALLGTLKELSLKKAEQIAISKLCLYREDDDMGKIILYHGSPDKEIKPAFGLGENRHDYGKGFYLTENIDLAKEWAVCRPDETNGWVHKYELDMEGLKVLDFQKYSILSWLAELMKHRDAGKTLSVTECCRRSLLQNMVSKQADMM